MTEWFNMWFNKFIVILSVNNDESKSIQFNLLICKKVTLISIDDIIMNKLTV